MSICKLLHLRFVQINCIVSFSQMNFGFFEALRFKIIVLQFYSCGFMIRQFCM